MIYTLPYKTKQFFFVLIKISVVVIAFYFIQHKLTKNNSLEFYNFIQILIKNDVFLLKNILFLSLLTTFNWFFEILKWQELVSSIKKLSLIKAAEQCLGSLTVSLFTPNRIGEYGAKALYYNKDYRKQIMAINLVSNVLQMVTTCVFGILGLIFLDQVYEIHIIKWPIFLWSYVFLLMLVTLIIIKKRSRLITDLIEKLQNLMLNFSKNNVVKGLLFSIFRYVIFSFQFYFLLTLFGYRINYFDAMVFISSMYFLASVIPSIFIFDVVIKGSIAVFLFSLLGFNELIILSIITIMWILNFMLPSILGSYFVLRFKLPILTK